MEVKEYAIPLCGKTSFTMMCSGYSSATVNIKRRGKLLTICGVGGTAGNKTLALNIYGTNADNNYPSHYLRPDINLIASIAITTTMPATEIDVSGYDRIIAYSVYGSGTVGTGSETVCVLIEN